MDNVSTNTTTIKSGAIINEEFWVDYLNNIEEIAVIPLDSPATNHIENNDILARKNIKIEGELFRKLDQISNGSDSMLFVILLSIWKVLLFKYTNIPDVIQNIPLNKQSNGKNYKIGRAHV